MRKPLEKELKSYREQGISLYLNGILSNPKTIAKACQISPPDVHNAFGQHKNIITHILKICEKYDFAIQL